MHELFPILDQLWIMFVWLFLHWKPTVVLCTRSLINLISHMGVSTFAYRGSTTSRNSATGRVLQSAPTLRLLFLGSFIAPWPQQECAWQVRRMVFEQDLYAEWLLRSKEKVLCCRFNLGWERKLAVQLLVIHSADPAGPEGGKRTTSEATTTVLQLKVKIQ